MQHDEPLFPPLLNSRPVEPGVDAAGVALLQIAAGKSAAGDTFWSQSQDRMNLAIVLEPEVPLARAAQMLHLMAVSFGDAFGAIAPPEIAVQVRWPGDILVNGAKVGSVSLWVPAPATAVQLPSVMVLGLDIAVSLDLSAADPGDFPDRTTLHEEGAGDITSVALLESVSRHFLTWLDTWTHEGFKAVHKNWWGRAAGIESDIDIQHCGRALRGRVTGMDDEGNLLFRSCNSDCVQGLALLEVLNRTEM